MVATMALEKVMGYEIILYESEEGVAVFCPDLPGCWSQGETKNEATLNIEDAIQGYLAALNVSKKIRNLGS